MDENNAQGKRLAYEIEKRGIKIKAFAEMTGIIPNTLSRILNGRQPLSKKFIKRSAEILGVSEAYLRCETDDPTPSVIFEDDSHINEDMLKYNSQQYRFLYYQQFLKSMGLEVNYRMVVSGQEYFMDAQGLWHDLDNPKLCMDEHEADDLIRQNRESARVCVDLLFKDKKLTLDYSKYRRWLKNKIVANEGAIQELMDVYYTVNRELADDDTTRALRGEEPLSWFDKA